MNTRKALLLSSCILTGLNLHALFGPPVKNFVKDVTKHLVKTNTKAQFSSSSLFFKDNSNNSGISKIISGELSNQLDGKSKIKIKAGTLTDADEQTLREKQKYNNPDSTLKCII